MPALAGSSPGGANHFTDGFAVAERMRRQHPEEFELLCSQNVSHVYNQRDDRNYRFTSGMVEVLTTMAWRVASHPRCSRSVPLSPASDPPAQFHKRCSRPTFSLDQEGRLRQVAFNNQVQRRKVGEGVEEDWRAGEEQPAQRRRPADPPPGEVRPALEGR